MAGAAQTIGWILTVDDTDVVNKLGTIKARTGDIRSELKKSIGDAMKPVVDNLIKLRKSADEIQGGLKDMFDPETWKQISKALTDGKPTIDKLHDTVKTAAKAEIGTKGWWDAFKEYMKENLLDGIVNGIIDIFKIGEFILSIVSKILVGVAALSVFIKQIAGPLIGGVLKALNFTIGAVVKVSLSAIATVTTGLLKSGFKVLGIFSSGLSLLGKTASTAISTALGPIFVVANFLAYGLKKVLGPIFSMVNGFVKTLMFVFEPFFMAFRLLLFPFVFALLPLATRLIVGIMLKVLEGIKFAVSMWKRWKEGGWDLFVSDVKEFAGAVWEEIKAGAWAFWEWLSTDGWDLFASIASDVWDAVAAGALAFGSWFETTAWPNIKTSLGLLFDWLVDVAPRAWDAWQKWVNGTLVPWATNTGKTISDWLSGIIQTAWDFWKPVFSGAWDAVKKAFKGLANLLFVPLNWIRSVLGGIIKYIGQLMVDLGRKTTDIPGIASAGPALVDLGYEIKSAGKELKKPIPALAEGGMVTKPTLALIGERGSELVIPVSRPSDLSSGAGGSVQSLDDPLKWFKDMLMGIKAVLESIDNNTQDSNWVNDPDFGGHTNRGDWET